jgi:hypothetical protein
MSWAQSPSGFEPRSFGLPVHSLVTALTELFRTSLVNIVLSFSDGRQDG